MFMFVGTEVEEEEEDGERGRGRGTAYRAGRDTTDWRPPEAWTRICEKGEKQTTRVPGLKRGGSSLLSVPVPVPVPVSVPGLEEEEVGVLD